MVIPVWFLVVVPLQAEGFGGVSPPADDVVHDGVADVGADTTDDADDGDDDAFNAAVRRQARAGDAWTPPVAPAKPATDPTSTNALVSPVQSSVNKARARLKDSPMRTLRAEINDAEKAWHALERNAHDPDVSLTSIERAEAHAKERRAVLDDVEILALRLRERCMVKAGKSARLPGRVPIGVRLKPTTPGMDIFFRVQDEKPCTREMLVDDDVIARIERLHQIEKSIPLLGYRDIAEKRAQETMRDEMMKEILGTDAYGLKPLVFTTRTLDEIPRPTPLKAGKTVELRSALEGTVDDESSD